MGKNLVSNVVEWVDYKLADYVRVARWSARLC